MSDTALRAAALPIHPYLRGVLFIAAVSLLFWLLALPFSLYSTFSIESAFRIQQDDPAALRGGYAERARHLARSSACPVLLGLFWFMDRTGRLWWIWAFGAMTRVPARHERAGPARHRPAFQQVHPARRTAR